MSPISCRRYEGGETTQQVGKRYGIFKSRVASILTLSRRPHPTSRASRRTSQRSPPGSYRPGKSLAWIGAVYGVSHTTVAAALRRRDVEAAAATGLGLGATTTVGTKDMVGAIAARARQLRFVVCDAAMASVVRPVGATLTCRSYGM